MVTLSQAQQRRLNHTAIVGIALLLLLTPALFSPLNTRYSQAAIFLTQLSLVLLVAWCYVRILYNRIQLLEVRIRSQQHLDQVTGLPNKTELLNMLTEMSRQPGQPGCGLLIVSFGKFKSVNNRFGFDVGDQILRESALRISMLVQWHDATLARIGGSEFALLLPNLADAPLLDLLCQRLCRSLERPFKIKQQSVFLSTRIGAAVTNGQGVSEELLSNAYAALQQVKEHHKHQICFFDEDIKTRLIEQSELEHDLRQAVARGELQLHYQPQVTAVEGGIIGAEALVRWSHPTRGLLQPLEFIPLAESTGLIVEIGHWVLEHACLQAAAWNQGSGPGLRIAVNISAVQFTKTGLVERIAEVLNTSGLNPALLELELTESILLEDHDQVVTKLQQLKSLGVKISIDDFGTGYSSLRYIRDLPVDRIKIDRAFTGGIKQTKESAGITLAILTMARSLNMQVIAEGVETRQQKDFLSEHTCNEMQGFYFARPMPAEQLSNQYLLRATAP